MHQITIILGVCLCFWFVSLHLVAAALLYICKTEHKGRLISALIFNSTNFSLLVWISVLLLSIESIIMFIFTPWIILVLLCFGLSIFMLFCHSIAMFNVIQMIDKGDMFDER